MQMLQHSVAVRGANHIEMINVANVWRFEGSCDASARQQLIVEARVRPARLGPLFQMRQLCAENCRLQRVYPLRVSDFFVLVFCGAPVIPKLAHAFQKRLVVAGDRAGITVSAKVLSRIKTKASQIADAAAALSKVFRRVGLRSVLDQPKTMAGRDVAQRLKLGRLTVEMHRYDR